MVKKRARLVRCVFATSIVFAENSSAKKQKNKLVLCKWTLQGFTKTVQIKELCVDVQYLVIFLQYKNCLKIVGTLNTLMKQENTEELEIIQ